MLCYKSFKVVPVSVDNFLRKKSSLKLILGCFLLSTTAGCAFMPSVGPHADYIKDQVKAHQAPPLVNVDTKIAKDLSIKSKLKEESQENELLSELGSSYHGAAVNRVFPGDKIRVVIWTQGGGQAASSAESSDSSSSAAPGSMSPVQSRLGIYPVDYRGRIDIPYAGFVNVGGKTIHEAQRAIQAQLAQTHQFESVEVTLQPEVTHGQNIVVLGSVNKPSIINWNDGGVNLVEAIAEAGGYVNGEPLHGSDLGMNVLLVRQDRSYDIPLRTALMHQIALEPGDRIALQHKPNVRVLCLGAGWTSPRMAPFTQIPTLSQVMASVNGLNPQTAQGRAIFILKKDQSVIYKINFDRVEGMEASQIMPIEDGDMVYSPVARSVTMQQVLGMFMFMAGQGMSAASVK